VHRQVSSGCNRRASAGAVQVAEAPGKATARAADMPQPPQLSAAACSSMTPAAPCRRASGSGSRWSREGCGAGADVAVVMVESAAARVAAQAQLPCTQHNSGSGGCSTCTCKDGTAHAVSAHSS
jgi:hypothetical protein